MPCSAILGTALLASIGCSPISAPAATDRYEPVMASATTMRDAPRVSDARLAEIRGGAIRPGTVDRFTNETRIREMTDTVSAVAQQSADFWFATIGNGLVANNLFR